MRAVPATARQHSQAGCHNAHSCRCRCIHTFFFTVIARAPCAAEVKTLECRFLPVAGIEFAGHSLSVLFPEADTSFSFVPDAIGQNILKQARCKNSNGCCHTTSRQGSTMSMSMLQNPQPLKKRAIRQHRNKLEYKWHGDLVLTVSQL